jgi:hypothetical protein
MSFWGQRNNFFRKFIAKIQMTFLYCADINLCLHSYLFPSQTELKVIGHHNTYVRPKLKVIEYFVRRFPDRYSMYYLKHE